MAGNAKPEKIEQTINGIFDELQNALETKRKLHPSEDYGKNNEKNHSWHDAYIIINSYHFYCTICDEHLYSQSVLNDINSFFQMHINTNYHKSNKLLNPCINKPILKWEKWLCTGYCNICELSGIHSYIIETPYKVSQLAGIHVCKYDQQLVDNYYKFLKKVELIKLYCSLSIFVNKFLNLSEGSTICFLCMEKFTGAPEKNRHHLASNKHLENFCRLIMKNFNFAIKDLLNGFNLEKITLWILNKNFILPCKISTVINEKEECLNSSNCCPLLYSEKINYSGFSPMFMANLLTNQTDLILNNSCILCNENINSANHMADQSHLKITKDLSPQSFKNIKLYNVYKNNRSRRLEPFKTLIEAYRKLQNELDNFGLKIGIEYVPSLENIVLKSILHKNPGQKSKNQIVNLPWEVNDTKSLLAQKQKFLKNTFFKANNGQLFCEFCDCVIFEKSKSIHLSQKSHETEVHKWNELILKLNNPNFLKPLRKIKTDFACFACKTAFGEASLFSHLKGVQHSRKVSSVPDPSVLLAWLNFKFMSDLSCYCENCGAEMSISNSVSTLRTTVGNICDHWPCSQGSRNKMENSNVDKNHINVKSDNSKMLDTVSVASVSNSFHFMSVKNTLKNLTEMFDDKIIEHVKNNSLSSINSSNKQIYLEKGKGTNEVPAAKKNTLEYMTGGSTVPSSINNLKLDNLSIVANKAGEISSNNAVIKDIKDGKVEETNLLKVTNQTLEVKNESLNPGKSNALEEKQNEKEFNDHENNVEELLLSDVPYDKEIRNQISDWLQKFGKVKYLLFKENSGVVAFSWKGIAEEVAKTQVIHIGKHDIKITYISKTNSSNEKIKIQPLNLALVRLFSEIPKLINFISELMSQSSKIAESLVEKKRVQLVCNTVITTLMYKFPLCKCFLFGSRLTGLTLSNSDMDLFFDYGDMYDGFKTPKNEKTLVNEVAGALWNSKECRQLIVVDRARVPIISFQHSITKLHCDLSFKNGLAVQNTILLRYMVSVNEKIKPVILFLKRWADINCLHGPPYFSSYAIAMLAIFFFQQPPYPLLPSIETLKKNYVGHRMTIGGWDCNFSTDKSLIPSKVNPDSLPELLFKFFNFYASFEYSKYVISPLTGEPLSREVFASDSSGLKLPMSIKRHILNMPLPIKNLVPPRYVICILDPFDLSHILTKSFSKRALDMFVHFCRKSAEHLEKGLVAAEKNILKK